MAGYPELRIGIVLEAFTGRPLDELLAWLRRAAPEITHIEVGAAGTPRTRTATWPRSCPARPPGRRGWTG